MTRVDAPTCQAPKNGVPFGPLCRASATWITPVGSYLCEQCAEREMAAIGSGSTLLNLLAERRGITTDQLLAKYARISDPTTARQVL
jgi:hypothetical protein